MVQFQGRLELQRTYATQLLNQLTEEYETLKVEMQQVAQQYPGLDDEFSFLEEFELWIVDISGYASQIQSTGSIKQFDTAIDHLQQLQVSANPIFARFYFEASANYSKIQAYLQKLDYLRLLVLEYLQMQAMARPVSA